MVWRKTRRDISGPQDVTIAREGFVFVDGVTSSFSFDRSSQSGNNPYLPVLQLIKVHRGYPLELRGFSPDLVRVSPRGERGLQSRYCEDRQIWDVYSFLIVPQRSALNDEEKGAWRSHALPDSFLTNDFSPAEDSLLLSLPGRIGIETNAGTIVYGQLPPSQVVRYLFSWLTRIVGIPATQPPLRNRGTVSVSLDVAKPVVNELIGILEKYYRSRLQFNER